MPTADSPANALHPVLIKLMKAGCAPALAQEAHAISPRLFSTRCTQAAFLAIGSDPSVESVRLVAARR